jgi:excisionase family DNA binding protein
MTDDVAAALHRIADILERRIPPQRNARSPTVLLSVADVAAELGVRRGWVYAHQEQLGAIKVGGHVRFPAGAVERYLKDCR